MRHALLSSYTQACFLYKINDSTVETQFTFLRANFLFSSLCSTFAEGGISTFSDTIGRAFLCESSLHSYLLHHKLAYLAYLRDLLFWKQVILATIRCMMIRCPLMAAGWYPLSATDAVSLKITSLASLRSCPLPPFWHSNLVHPAWLSFTSGSPLWVIVLCVVNFPHKLRYRKYQCHQVHRLQHRYTCRMGPTELIISTGHKTIC